MVKNIVSPKKKPRRIVGTAGLPQLTYRGGPLIQNVEVTTIYWGNAWQNDPIRAQRDAFFDFIVTSSLIDQLTEYNVPGFTIGHGKHVASLIVPHDPPATVDDTAIVAFVQQQIASGAVPAQDANSLYFVFTPSGVTVSLQGSASCQQFCGYHDTHDGSLFYAVVPYAACAGCEFAGTVFREAGGTMMSTAKSGTFAKAQTRSSIQLACAQPHPPGLLQTFRQQW